MIEGRGVAGVGYDDLGLVAVAPLLRSTVLEPEDAGGVAALERTPVQRTLDAVVDMLLGGFYGLT